MVWLKLRNYNLAGIRNRKLAPPRAGPYLIKEVVGKGLTYRLDLRSNFKIHLVISITELEPTPQSVDAYDRPR